MTFEHFREKYGTAFYGFINSELGQALVSVLEKNDPATRVVALPPEAQTANSTLFLGQTTGWRDCVLCIENQLIVTGDAPPDMEPTYEGEQMAGMGIGGNSLPSNDPAPPSPIPIPRRKKSSTKTNPKSKKQ